MLLEINLQADSGNCSGRTILSNHFFKFIILVMRELIYTSYLPVGTQRGFIRLISEN